MWRDARHILTLLANGISGRKIARHAVFLCFACLRSPCGTKNDHRRARCAVGQQSLFLHGWGRARATPRGVTRRAERVS